MIRMIKKRLLFRDTEDALVRSQMALVLSNRCKRWCVKRINQQVESENRRKSQTRKMGKKLAKEILHAEGAVEEELNDGPE